MSQQNNSERSLKVVTTSDSFLVVAITDRGETKEYLVRPLPTGARWEEIGEVGYNVEGQSCQCRWAKYRRAGQKVCRHVAATAALVACGKLAS